MGPLSAAANVLGKMQISIINAKTSPRTGGLDGIISVDTSLVSQPMNGAGHSSFFS
jgi:hypothetical protein